MGDPKEMQMSNPTYKQVLVQDPSHNFTTSKEDLDPSINYNMYPSKEKTEAGTQPFKKLTIIVAEPGLTTAQSLKKCI